MSAAAMRLQFAEQPLVAVLYSGRLDTACAYCFRPAANLRRCGRCRSVRYCGGGCQLADWLQHRLECRCAAYCPPMSDGRRRSAPAMVRLLQRLLADNERKGGPVVCSAEWNAIGEGRTFEQLQGHTVQMKGRLDKMEQFAVNSRVLREYAGEEMQLPEAAELLEIYCKVCVNAVHVQNDNLQRVGIGLYLRLSSLDHSCEPNACVVFDGRTALLRAHGAAAPPPADIRISYVDTLTAGEERRAELLDSYFFACHCARCEDECDDDRYLRTLCTGCRSALPAAPRAQTDVRCDQCGATVERSHAAAVSQEIDWFLHRVDEEIDTARSANDPFYHWLESVSSCAALYERAASHLCPAGNRRLLLLAERAGDAALGGLAALWRDDDNDGGERLVGETERRLLEAADRWLGNAAACAGKLYAAGRPELTVALVRAGGAALAACDRRRDYEGVQKAQRWHSLARENCLLSHGADHPLCRAIAADLAQCRADVKAVADGR